MTSTPRSVLVYGLLGLLPFWLLPLAALIAEEHARSLLLGLAAYGALIASFLGGARWGAEIMRPKPRDGVIGLAMLPTLAALAFLTLAGSAPRLQLLGLAVVLSAILVWDLLSDGLPSWYPALRVRLSVGAIIGLCAGALIQ